MILNEVVKLEDTSGRRRSHTCVQCNNCDNLFYKPTRFLADENFCSAKCASEKRHKLGSESVKCAECGKETTKRKSVLKNSRAGFFFCSRACKEQAQRIGGIKEIQPPHYGVVNSDYRLVVERDRGITHCEECGWNLHPEVLEVHHIDCNRENNVLENLKVLCPNCHQWEHYSKKTGKHSKQGLMV